MTVSIHVAGAAYSHPSSAADMNWAAQQVALLQALAAAVSKGPALQKLYQSAVAIGTLGNDEETLMSFNVPAGTLAAGSGLRVTAWGAGISTDDATTVKVYVGTAIPTTVFGVVLEASQANLWRAEYDLIVHTDGGFASVGGTFTQYNAGSGSVLRQVQSLQSITLDVASAQLVRVTGQLESGAAADAVIQYGMGVVLVP